MTEKIKILNDISKYYTEKIYNFGATPKGVDWKDENSQLIRFEKLSEVISKNENFTINDLGCGYGKYFEFLNTIYSDFIYKGYDLSQMMIDKSIEIYGKFKNTEFITIKESKDISISDYTIASGIFNVKMNYEYKEWEKYILDSIRDMNEKSKKGFSFNMLSQYSDKEYMRNDLYYAHPSYYFDYCKKKYSRNVSLLHDYNFYEFTILVKK